MTDSVYFGGLGLFSLAADATLIEQSVHKLRSAIMRGDLRPGQKLVEASLCKSLDISRASLREALRALEAEKLIELVPNRGPSVAKLGFQEVEEIHEVWALLTGQAVADFTQQAKKADIAKLEVALAQLAEHTRNNTPLGELTAINAFFSHILTRCGNRVLVDMICLMVARVNFLRAQALVHQSWGSVFVEEINDIYVRIKEGDRDGARLATCKHISTACAAAKQRALELSPELRSAGSASTKKAASGRASVLKKSVRQEGAAPALTEGGQ